MKLITYIAGCTFGDRPSEVKKLKKGDILELIPEPTNAYDPFAVKVANIGYLKKEIAKEISPLILAGQKHYAIVVDLNAMGGVRVVISDIESNIYGV